MGVFMSVAFLRNGERESWDGLSLYHVLMSDELELGGQVLDGREGFGLYLYYHRPWFAI